MPPCLRFKAGVTLTGLQPGGARILATADRATSLLGRDLTVTCGTDSHGPDDPHTRGLALDFRVKDLTPAEILRLYRYLSTQLGTAFRVLLEAPRSFADPLLAEIEYVNPHASAPHVHCQVRRGVEFPESLA